MAKRDRNRQEQLRSFLELCEKVDLMVARRDGGQVGHIDHGRIEPLANRDVEIAQVAALN